MDLVRSPLDEVYLEIDQPTSFDEALPFIRWLGQHVGCVRLGRMESDPHRVLLDFGVAPDGVVQGVLAKLTGGTVRTLQASRCERVTWKIVTWQAA